MTSGLAQELKEIERELAVLVARFMRLQDVVAQDAKQPRPAAPPAPNLPRTPLEPLAGYQ